MSEMTPREIVSELDQHIIGQKEAKRAVAIALRNRWRRMQLQEPLRHEVTRALSLWDRQPSNAPPLLLSPAGLASRWGPHTKTHLGLCPKTPLPLNCGWIRTMRSIVRTAPQIRS